MITLRDFIYSIDPRAPLRIGVETYDASRWLTFHHYRDYRGVFMLKLDTTKFRYYYNDTLECWEVHIWQD